MNQTHKFIRQISSSCSSADAIYFFLK